MTKDQFYDQALERIDNKSSNYAAETQMFNCVFGEDLSRVNFTSRLNYYRKVKNANPEGNNRFNGVNDFYHRFCMEEMVTGSKDYKKGAQQYNDLFGGNVDSHQFATRIYKYMKTHGFELHNDGNHNLIVTYKEAEVPAERFNEKPEYREEAEEKTPTVGVKEEESPRGVEQPRVYSRTETSDGIIEVRDVISYKDDMRGNKTAIMEFMGFNAEEWECISMRESIWEGGKGGANRYSVQLKVRPRKEPDFNPEKFAAKARAVFERTIEPRAIDDMFDYKPYGVEAGTGKVVMRNGAGVKKYLGKSLGEGLTDSKLFLIPQIEAHLGKIANKLECSNVYNHEIVEKRVRKVFDEVIIKQQVERCSTALIVIGGDFFNSESNNATTAGTPQNATDTRYVEMYGIGLRLYQEGIELLKKHFNRVDVLLCSGNHARAMELFLYRALECYYSKDEQVSFKEDYHETQSYVFGTCGLFFNHGDVNQKRLVASIPCEFPDEWGKTRSRYLFCGHLHKLEVSNNENGLIFHRTPAICENDAWHYSNRFGIGVVPQHEIMVFDKACGMTADFNIYFNETR